MTPNRRFGELPDGRPVRIWDLRSVDGSGPRIMDLGAAIVTLAVPDRGGNMANVTLGFDEPQAYLSDDSQFGAVIGRYANRIAGARFMLNGAVHRIDAREGGPALHGGRVGFSKRLWRGRAIASPEGIGVRFALFSPDGDQGFPGDLRVATRYIWTTDHRLIVDFSAIASRATPFNITQHSYWNLSGILDGRSALDHDLQIHADSFLPLDGSQIPTGELRSVAGTPFDFRAPKAIGRNIDDLDEQIARGNGFDHTWTLAGAGLREGAVLSHVESGRRLRVLTDQPGLHVYTGNFIDGVTGANGVRYRRYGGIALETQHFPDAPNQPHFPDTILRPGGMFRSRTVFAFDWFNR